MKNRIINIITIIAVLGYSLVSCDKKEMSFSSQDLEIFVASDNFVPAPELPSGEILKSSEITHNGEAILAMNEHIVHDFPIVVDDPGTKGSVTTSGNMTSFGIDGYLRTSIAGADEHYINNKTVTKSGSTWSLYKSGATKYKWPYGGAIKFWARYPSSLAVTVAADRNSMSFSYTLPAHQTDNQDATRQLDIITSTAETSYTNGTSVGFNFGHALSGIRFDFTDLPATYTVKKIALKNIYNSGTCVVNSASTTSIDYTWTLGTTKGTYVQVITPATDLTEEFDRTSIMAMASSDKMFFVPPQTLPSDAQIVLTLEDGGTEFDVFHSLSGEKWLSTCMYTYNICNITTEWEYVVEGLSPVTVAYDGQTDVATGSVKSYRIKTSDPSVIEAVPWSFEYSSDNVNWSSSKPAWLSFNRTSGSGGTTGETVTTSVTAQSYTETTKPAATAHQVNLQNATPKGTSTDRYDLSYYNVATGEYNTSKRSTANTYVVNASGFYKFPIVYGNAIKDGSTNTTAYKGDPTPSGHTYTRYLRNLVNHADKDITNPWIKNNSDASGKIGDSFTAKIIWQDSQNLVTNVQVSSDHDYVEFEVPRNSIAQGNCVIAVLKGSTIVWSWQIWVTDEDLTDTETAISSETGNAFHFMKVNLGWYTAGMAPAKVYAERDYYVRANNGHASYTFKITQNAYEKVELGTRGSCTMYQWGRKDPFPGGDGTTSASTRTLDYAGNGYRVIFIYGQSLSDHEYVSVGKAIQQPYYMNHHWGTAYYIDWNDMHYHNLWSTNLQVPDDQTSFSGYKYIPTVKTVYDPSPVGFKVPEGDAFSAFNDSNTRFNNSVKGFEYKVGGETRVFFPACGCLSSGVMQTGTHWYNLNTGFNIWSASPQGHICTAWELDADLSNVDYGWDIIDNSNYFNKGNAEALHVITE